MKVSFRTDARERSKRFFLVLLLVILIVLSLAFDSYSKKNTQTITLPVLAAPIVNPLMGWAPWASLKQIDQPHTLVYADLTWREFEPSEGYFDFDTFERKQQLARWRQEGKRVVFRFVVDIPGTKPHRDIPDWLFEKIKGAGAIYDTEYGKGFSPDYSNPIFVQYHKKAIRALGERYGKDGFFAFVELGSLGHWGEWHTHPDIAPLPSEAVRNEYVMQYREAFPETQLLMRRPFPIAQRLGLGLYNDLTGDRSQTNIWLDWIANGGEYLPGGQDVLVAMPKSWQTAPIGGEQSPSLSNEQVYGTDIEQTVQLLENSHTTFIGPNSPFRVEPGDPLQAGINRVLTTIGYRIRVDHLELPRSIAYGLRIPIRITFANDGIAPMYYNWPVRLYLFDDEGRIVTTYQAQMDLRKILPGQLFEVDWKMPIGRRKNGIYSIGIAILDPLTGEPAVQFANQNSRPDRIQDLGAFEVNGVFNFH